MGRKPCCAKETDLKRGAWTAEEDGILEAYIKTHGEGRWRSLPKKAGLKRCGKSCRLRWLNYLRPDIKRGNISLEEEDLIIRLHKLIGNRWSLIAGRLPGRTDNEIKNYWNTYLRKKVQNQHEPAVVLSSLHHFVQVSREGDLVAVSEAEKAPESVPGESFSILTEGNWWDLLMSSDAGEAASAVQVPHLNLVSLCGDDSRCDLYAANEGMLEDWMCDPAQTSLDRELESLARFLHCDD
ncbi:unnamed protein product [Musa acuminata subsp. malaccensis]|uniref:(wild Malaysian banana) hypothetical protein n=1 Tax=Musa acuminata subsp. malaccensis TaxID=214687 RepID=A0A804I9M3_MUSAM|nr:PREDICTED: myb-related protein Hv1-like [Musa acuminata subsp. malaccensis]CAG1849489.1 unnamed protein product [Musa acuminata subsp. malaccensis]